MLFFEISFPKIKKYKEKKNFFTKNSENIFEDI